jgi:hypothetical protein
LIVAWNEAKRAAKDREEWKLRVEASCSSRRKKKKLIVALPALFSAFSQQLLNRETWTL